MEGCIFCNIVERKIPSAIVYENDKVLAFKDINPVAPVHIIIIPKTHLANINELTAETAPLLGDIHLAAKEVAGRLGIAEKGYRMISNCGADAGQTVPHLHYHLIGGLKLGAKIV